MSTIQEREYVEKIEGRFHPTTLGKTVNDLLIGGGFDDLFNVTYTARMEEELDDIEEGKIKWTDALHEFYGKFQDDLGKFQQYIKTVKAKDVPTDEVCVKCGTPGMVEKFGRFGKYLKCLNCGATRDAESPGAGSSDGSATAQSAGNRCNSSAGGLASFLAARAIPNAATFVRSRRAAPSRPRLCRWTRSVRLTVRSW